MELFPDGLAERNKERDGHTYYPANGTEADMFFLGEYQECTHQSTDGYWCITENLSFINDRYDIMYPIELQYGIDGQPCCRRKTVLPGKQG